MIRCAALSIDLAASLVVLAITTATIAYGMQDRLALRRLDRASSDLEIAQNCFVDFRAQRSFKPPTGWTATVEVLEGGWERLVLSQANRRLITLRKQP